MSEIPAEAIDAAAAAIDRVLDSEYDPSQPNALARHVFMRGVAAARGDGETVLGYDGLMITMPADSEAVSTSDLI